MPPAPFWPVESDVVAERARVIVAAAGSTGSVAAAALVVVPLAVAGVTIGGTSDESVDLLGDAVADGEIVVVVVVAAAVVVVVGVRLWAAEPNGWVKVGTKEDRWDGEGGFGVSAALLGEGDDVFAAAAVAEVG